VKLIWLHFLLLGMLPLASISADTSPAASAVNELGLDLYRQIGGGTKTGKGTRIDNVCLSPYSIQIALAMTYAGAEGETRTQMAKVLHYGPNEMDPSFSALRTALDDSVAKSVAEAEHSKKYGGPSEPITLETANRLFGQTGYDFRAPFLDLLKDRYGAPLDALDFMKKPDAATKIINDWVAGKTHQRIRDLIPLGGLTTETQLVLTNAIYLKAPWAKEFSVGATKPEPFHRIGNTTTDVPMMVEKNSLGFYEGNGFSAVTLPYSGGDLQFLIILPTAVDGLPAIERGLTASILSDCAKAESRDIIVHLPKFKLVPATLSLGEMLRALGMRAAFDQPKGSANFDRIAPRKPNDYLAISEVYHKTFISVDEKGTEAAAATAVAMAKMAMAPKSVEPLVFKVDHPFIFAIQHRPSGACLFLGRVADPGKS
jgi:serpin B